MKKELIYKKPECLVIEIEAQSVLCGSGIVPANPFGGSTEEEWF